MTTWLTRGLLACLVLSSGCGGTHESPAPAQQSALGGEIAARVGSDVIPVSLVTKVGAAQHVPASEALRRLVDDAVAANAARAKGLDRELPTSWYLTAARGRVTADRLLADAKRRGPPTDDEVKTLSERYWREVDRPPAVSVVHVVVRTPEKPDPAANERAHAFALQLRDAVVGAKDADDFIAKANAVPTYPGGKVQAEKLPPFTEAGQVVEGTDGFDPTFAKGAFAISEPGMTSQPVQTSFGWHVVRLIERIPEQRMPLETRRIAFADEVITMRAGTATKSLMQGLQRSTPIEIAPSAEILMRSLMSTAGHGPTP